ncbi:MAG: peptidoglycan-binding protein [Syntrophomonadaceae bacterium]|nr:peptidoglycan-binding protein [Syntrophomonadaceae bacterium]
MPKRFFSIVLLLIMVFTLSGCSLFGGGETEKKTPVDTEMLEESSEGPDESTAAEEDQEQLELKQLNYSDPATGQEANNQSDETSSTVSQAESTDGKSANITISQPVEYKPDYRIHFLNEEEAKLVTEKLIKLGYLKQAPKDTREFSDAVYRFQQAEKIEGSGDINPETFNRLRSK